jgi:hypothetical protein
MPNLDVSSDLYIVHNSLLNEAHYLATPASIEKKSESVMDQVTIDPVQSDVSPTIDGKTDDVLSIDVPKPTAILAVNLYMNELAPRAPKTEPEAPAPKAAPASACTNN